MRNLNGFKWIYALVIFGTTASADLIIDSSTIPSGDISSISIGPATGNVFVNTIPGYTVSKSNTTPPPPDAVAITGFSVSPASILVGGTTTVTWSTVNANSCTPSGDTGWINKTLGVNGSTDITINSTGTKNLTLTCVGDVGDPAVAHTSVTVTETAPPPPPPVDNCPTPALSGSVLNWKDLFLVDFPKPGYDNRFATVPRLGYYALKFYTGSIVDDGKMSSIETTITDGVRLGAFSECPGDFDVAPECTYIWGISGGIRWATNGRLGACALKANTTYYFNITFTNGVSASTTSCNSSPCITQLQHVNQ